MRVAQSPRPDQRKSGASAAGPEAGNGASPPDTTRVGASGGRDPGRGRSKGPEAALRDVLRGLRAGDLECVLLTVAMAAKENRMPYADPDEAGRILAFLARLAEHDAMLPPSPPPRPAGSGAGPEGPVDGGGAEDGAPDPG